MNSLREPPRWRQFTITLKAEPGVADPLRALKAVLKYAGRVHGLKCLLLCPEPHRPEPGGADGDIASHMD